MKKHLKTNYYLQNSAKFGWGNEDVVPEYKIQEIIPHIEGKKILDIGCGVGHLVNEFNQRGFDAKGVDFVKKFIDFANQKHGPHFVHSVAEKLPFKSKEFDTAILKSVLEHVDNDTKVLQESLRVSKKVIIIVPQVTDNKLKDKGLIFSHYQDKTHQRNYSDKSLRLLASKSGGKIVKIIQIEKLPVKSILFELANGHKLLKRLLIKFFFIFLREKHIYLELLAIIKPCK